MKRTQLNITIAPDLLFALKRESIKTGMTLSNKVSEILTLFLSKQDSYKSSVSLEQLERKVIVLEKKLSELSMDKQKITPFTEIESKNCSEFIREIFYKRISKDKCITRKDAFDELIKKIECFHQWSPLYTLRLKEVLFIDDYEPFSAKELNDLTLGKECSCPIRTGLINWIEGSKESECSCTNIKFPSQQEICEAGSSLVKNII